MVIATEDILNFLIVNKIELEVNYSDDTAPSVKGVLVKDAFDHGFIILNNGDTLRVDWRYVKDIVPDFKEWKLFNLINLGNN